MECHKVQEVLAIGSKASPSSAGHFRPFSATEPTPPILERHLTQQKEVTESSTDAAAAWQPEITASPRRPDTPPWDPLRREAREFPPDTVLLRLIEAYNNKKRRLLPSSEWEWRTHH
jgi:hypothetical protein